MLVILICIVIGILWGAGISASEDESVVAGGVAGGVIGIVLGCLVALIVGSFVYNDTHWEAKQTVPLVSLQDGEGVEGHFFLGSGVIESEPGFTWYEQSAENAYVQNHAFAYESTVHMGGGQPHYVRSVEVYDDGSFLGKWGFRIETGEDGNEAYDFYVPQGSIKQDYTLDAK